ncbi:MAG: putative ABC transport system ATP-binding protein [Planctomycetota bacterium]|jgi:putative ABC transport system ATP-binding protein
MTINPLLMLKSVEKSYAIGQRDVQVLRGVDLTVENGDFVVIQGQEGSGKSALLNILAGIERSSGGEVKIDGKAIEADMSGLALLGSMVSFLSPVFCLDARMTIHETLTQHNLVKNLPTWQALELAGIEADDNRRICELDQEMRRKVGTARAFMARPRLILADLTPPPWGVPPSLESLEVANRKLGSAIVVASTQNVDIPQSRVFHLKGGKMAPTTLATM